MAGRHNWTDFFVPDQGVLLESFLPAADFLALLQRRNGLQELLLIDSRGRQQRLDFDEPAYELELVDTFDYHSPCLRFTYSSMTRPEQTIDYHSIKKTRTLIKEQELPSGHWPGRYEDLHETALNYSFLLQVINAEV